MGMIPFNPPWGPARVSGDVYSTRAPSRGEARSSVFTGRPVEGNPDLAVSQVVHFRVDTLANAGAPVRLSPRRRRGRCSPQRGKFNAETRPKQRAPATIYIRDSCSPKCAPCGGFTLRLTHDIRRENLFSGRKNANNWRL